MQIELHRNNVYQGAELLLLVSMLFLLAIPKCLLIFKENFYYTSLYTFSIIIYYPKDHSYTRLIIDLTNNPFLTYQEDGAEYRAQCTTLDKLPRCLKLGERNKMAALGYVNTRGDKLPPRSNAVCVGLPPAPRYLPFTSVRKSSHTTWVHRRPASCARSAQIFSGKNKNKN